MTTLFADQPDARQIPPDSNETVSRFRPRYRQLTEAEKGLHDDIKNKAEELAALIEQIKPGRYRALGLTALEESIMWSVKELTS